MDAAELKWPRGILIVRKAVVILVGEGILPVTRVAGRREMVSSQLCENQTSLESTIRRVADEKNESFGHASGKNDELRRRFRVVRIARYARLGPLRVAVIIMVVLKAIMASDT